MCLQPSLVLLLKRCVRKEQAIGCHTLGWQSMAIIILEVILGPPTPDVVTMMLYTKLSHFSASNTVILRVAGTKLAICCTKNTDIVWYAFEVACHRSWWVTNGCGVVVAMLPKSNLATQNQETSFPYTLFSWPAIPHCGSHRIFLEIMSAQAQLWSAIAKHLTSP